MGYLSSMTDDSFLLLMERVRAGDQDAAATLVRRHEAAVRRAVRFRLTDPRMRSLFDSMDICQSAMGSFFVRAAAGQFEVNSQEDLIKLLTTIARNKLVNHVRKERGGLALRGSAETLAADLSTAVSGEPDPGRFSMALEQCQTALERMTSEERVLLEHRRQGHNWDDVAVMLNSTPVALRKQLSRALDRVLQEVGLE